MRYSIYILLFITYSSFSQSNSLYPDVPYTDLYKVAVGDNYIYSAGSCDLLMISSDNGNTWSYVNFEGNVLDIDIVPGTSEEKAFILLKDKILVFDNNTGQFQIISDANLSLTAGYFRSLIVNNNNLYLISNGSVHKTVIGDYTWTKTTTFDISNDFVRYSDKTPDYIWVTTDKGKLIKTGISDNNAVLTKDFGTRISSFDMATDDTGYFVVNGKQYIQKTTDGGFEFTSLTNMPEAINPLAFGENQIMSVNTNRIYISNDGGKTSVYRPFPNDGYFNLVNKGFMTQSGILYMVGKSGMVLKSIDFGQSFINLNPYKRENLQDIVINNKGAGYAIGGNTTILHTTDFGNNWIPVEFNLSDDETFLQTIVSVNDNRFLFGHNKGISIVENGVVVSTDPAPCDLLLKSSFGDYIIAIRNIGNTYTVSKSIDEGNTWTNKISLPIYTNDLQESNTGKIFISGTPGTLITSVDGGENWDIIDIEDFDDKVQKFGFLNDDLGLLSTGTKLFITEDGGKTADFLINKYNVGNIYLFDDKHYLFTTGNSNRTVINETTNGGDSWISTGLFCLSTNLSYFDGDETIWLAQAGGHINKHIILETSSTQNIRETGTFSIFPNPVVSGQIIKINTEGFKAIAGYIMQPSTGQVIRKIMDTDIINTKGLKSGIYILKLYDGNIWKYGKFLIVD